jgi:glycopeptide antibiotics resistance protein
VGLRDAMINLAGFVPLGLLLGGLTRCRQIKYWRALALVATVSACLEALQICFAYRYPSSTDLILNTAGGGVGILFAHMAHRIRRASGEPLQVR